jgi:hypothetical protein
MSRRAFVAALCCAAIAGHVAGLPTAFDPRQIAASAVECADALLLALDAPPSRP